MEAKWKMLDSYMKYFNERGEADELRKYYKNLTKEEKKEFWDMVEQGEIYMNYPPMWEGMPAIDKIKRIAQEFDITRDDVYVHMYGRDIKIMRPVTVGFKYMLKLKQDSEKNFSARSTGSLSQQGVPEKSNKIRTNEMLFSTTPITLGRDENNNLGTSVEPFMLCKFHLFYRTSPFARRQIGKMYTNNSLDFDKFKIKPGYRNRLVEILNAKLKSMGGEIYFGFDGLNVEVEDNEIYEFDYKGEVFIMTKQEMREYLLEELMQENFKKLNLKGSKKELAKMYEAFKERELAAAKEGMLTIGFDSDSF
jgi:hypothetical protein